MSSKIIFLQNQVIRQCAKKVVSNSPGLVISVFNLPNGQVIFLLGIQVKDELRNQFCSSKSFWG